MNNITVYKRNVYGQVVWQYDGVVIERGATWVCLRAVFNGRESETDYVTFKRGDVYTEWFYSDRWYNVFRMNDGETGALKGWYCNITRPAHISHDSVAADDLALDVFVHPEGTVRLLDQHEFDALEISDAERAEALRAVETIRQQIARRAPPFDHI